MFLSLRSSVPMPRSGEPLVSTGSDVRVIAEFGVLSLSRLGVPVFTCHELDVARGAGDPRRALALLFAVKTAFAKAADSFWRVPVFHLAEVELRTPLGDRVEVVLGGSLQEWGEWNRVLISANVAHDARVVAASVTLRRAVTAACPASKSDGLTS